MTTYQLPSHQLPWRSRWMLHTHPVRNPWRGMRWVFAIALGLALHQGIPLGIYVIYYLDSLQLRLAASVGLTLVAVFLGALLPTIVDLPFAWKVKNLPWVAPIVTHRAWRFFVWVFKFAFFIWLFLLITQSFTNMRRF
ncbi:MAG: hypothetical protein Q4P06_08000 [Actinomycetaceae bacterium]|nr:hypothetical protein [Actinomycetaceae bacterium]